MSINPTWFEETYGPLYPYAEHKVGDVIRFRDPVTKQEHDAHIEWIRGPESYNGKTTYPVAYIMGMIDKGTGFPYEVHPGDVLQS